MIGRTISKVGEFYWLAGCMDGWTHGALIKQKWLCVCEQ